MEDKNANRSEVMLTGQAKRDYQRKYMRCRRQVVRPSMLDPVRPHVKTLPADWRSRLLDQPEIDADGNVIPEVE